MDGNFQLKRQKNNNGSIDDVRGEAIFGQSAAESALWGDNYEVEKYKNADTVTKDVKRGIPLDITCLY